MCIAGKGSYMIVSCCCCWLLDAMMMVMIMMAIHPLSSGCGMAKNAKVRTMNQTAKQKTNKKEPTIHKETTTHHIQSTTTDNGRHQHTKHMSYPASSSSKVTILRKKLGAPLSTVRITQHAAVGSGQSAGRCFEQPTKQPRSRRTIYNNVHQTDPKYNKRLCINFSLKYSLCFGSEWQLFSRLMPAGESYDLSRSTYVVLRRYKSNLSYHIYFYVRLARYYYLYVHTYGGPF